MRKTVWVLKKNECIEIIHYKNNLLKKKMFFLSINIMDNYRLIYKYIIKYYNTK